jgi:hypothetical protein
MSILVGRYNQNGYTIYALNGNFSYSAGNSPWDSNQYLVLDNPYALPVSDIRTMTRATLDELLLENPDCKDGGLDYDDSGNIP